MKNNLLEKTTLTTLVILALSACGTDEGYNPEFGSDTQITFSINGLSASFEEESGIQTVNLIEGAMVGDQPLSSVGRRINVSQLEFEAQNNFQTPQGPSNTIPTHTISPFTLSEDTTQLIIDTDAFAEALRMCDDTDETGDVDEDGNPIGDGNPDFPKMVTYDISFTIDNGYRLKAGESLPMQTLQLVMHAIDDPVTDVNVAALELPAGGQASVIASTVPSYACNSALTYTVADTSVATVDEDGLVTGTSTGQTSITATSVDNPQAQGSADVTVTAAFSIAIANGEVDELGAPTGEKMVGSCVAAGVKVEPSVINHTLTGGYDYDWSSSNSPDVSYVQNVSNGFGGVGVFDVGSNTNVASDVTVEIISGDTGATPIADVAGKSIELNVVTNEMCEPGVSEHAAGFNIDFDMDGVTAPYGGNAIYGTSTETISGSLASVKLTAGSAVDENGQPYSWGAQQVWNKQRNWYSANYGRGAESIGKTYKYAVWVKLETAPVEPITLRQVIVAWNYEGIPDGAAGFPGRFGEAGIFTAELAATTEWQYVEFVNDKSESQEWAIPATWSIVTDVFTLWEVYGLPEGQSILLDDYSVIRTDNISN
ncbi:Ig-like domain-containing protein [Shewanella sp. 5_MG-2023]|uniref:Ig-like domain-containing protein n=1 Tax=unclassified Shewanella TaxID=196818 RepID=UPI000C85E4C3|nr:MULTISPECIES: Ig-like domain-containing protein [unclassified Shewanella]MDO6641885.1 Ig-like domain-containing protein [Shewanella sp. 5_MG-2023]PMH99851.1 hypothetical protein BCU55_12370 [Shewanella sp. 10N.286.48.A6]